MTPEYSESRKCTQLELADLFFSYIVGDVEPDERKRIDEHLAHCAVCQEDMKFFSDLQRVGKEKFG